MNTILIIVAGGITSLGIGVAIWSVIDTRKRITSTNKHRQEVEGNSQKLADAVLRRIKKLG